MSRAIDTLPVPSHVREKKVIVTSRSRSGTYSLYQGLQMLGYRPYHMYEVVQSTKHMTILDEAIKAKYSGVGVPYGKAEFDKWFADYDALVEIPAFFVDDIVNAYPHAKYIHVDRDAEKWVMSMTAVMRTVEPLIDSQLVKFMSLFDLYLQKFHSLHITLLRVFFVDLKIDDPGAQKKIKSNYLKFTAQVKKLVPKDSLACFSLEDGFGWEQICPYLGKPVPGQPYPRGNAPKEFEALLAQTLGPSLMKAGVIALMAVLVPLVGFCAWYYRARM